MEKTTRCPICGVRISQTDAFCPNCKNPLVSDGSVEEQRLNTRKRILGRSYFNVFLFGVIIVVIWEVLAHVIPEGWGMAVLNILAFLVSIWVFWWPLFGYMKVTMPTWLAALASVLCWAFLFIGLRSLLGAIF
jgi:hypothetical protein